MPQCSVGSAMCSVKLSVYYMKKSCVTNPISAWIVWLGKSESAGSLQEVRLEMDSGAISSGWKTSGHWKAESGWWERQVMHGTSPNKFTSLELQYFKLSWPAVIGNTGNCRGFLLLNKKNEIVDWRVLDFKAFVFCFSPTL